jgi:hypothetical protein
MRDSPGWPDGTTGWGATEAEIALAPAARVRLLTDRIGVQAVAHWASDLLTAGCAPDHPDRPSILWLGGDHDAALVAQHQLTDPVHVYWTRVWAARALLHSWSPSATGAVALALANPAWRVREMAAKVARRDGIGQPADALAALCGDPYARVRAAAVSSLGVVGEAEHVDAVRTALVDPEAAIAVAAERALAQLSQRLDRRLEP